MALFVGNMPGLDKNFALNLSAYIFSPIWYCATYTKSSLLAVISHIKLGDYWLPQRHDLCHHLQKLCPPFFPLARHSPAVLNPSAFS